MIRLTPIAVLRVQGSEMDSGGNPSFAEGDIVVFSHERNAESGEFAFARYRGDRVTFRRIYHDENHILRLHAMREEVAPILLEVSDLISAWPLVAHVRST